jgi:hypothetical protein
MPTNLKNRFALIVALGAFTTTGPVLLSQAIQVDWERRTGYAWYGYWSAKLFENDYPRPSKSTAGENSVGCREHGG